MIPDRRAGCFHAVTREGLCIDVVADSSEMAATWVRGLVHVAQAVKPMVAAVGGRRESEDRRREGGAKVGGGGAW